VATELQKTDISDAPELLRLAEEVVASRSPRLLTVGDQAMVVVSPAKSAVSTPEEPKPASPRPAGDSILNIIGIGESAEPTDIAEDKQRYLAEAYGGVHEG
jgi:hypothetical protein